jgi:hypothetical protein
MSRVPFVGLVKLNFMPLQVIGVPLGFLMGQMEIFACSWLRLTLEARPWGSHKVSRRYLGAPSLGGRTKTWYMAISHQYLLHQLSSHTWQLHMGHAMAKP